MLSGLRSKAEPQVPDQFVESCEQWGGVKGQRPGSGESMKSNGSFQPLSVPLHAQLGSEGASTTASSAGDGFEVHGLEELELMGRLGAGSSGQVEKHRQVRTGRVLAVKIIQAKDIAEAQRQAILLELRTFAKCRNPHIVDFYGAFFHDNMIHIALEYMDAGALSSVLEKRHTVPEPLLADVAWQVLDGLEYLHCEMHVIHRDLKPSNLLLNYAGVVKITDFGVSGELEDDVGSKNKVTFVGTMYYMSPERVRGEPYKYDSDMWSLGVTLFECLSGKYPYVQADEGNMRHLSFWELMRRIVEQEAPSLPPGGGYSEPAQDFVRALLQKEPRNRASAAMMKVHPWLGGAPTPSQQEVLAAWIRESRGKSVPASPTAASLTRTATGSPTPPLQPPPAVRRPKPGPMPALAVPFSPQSAAAVEAGHLHPTASEPVRGLAAMENPVSPLKDLSGEMLMSRSSRSGRNPFAMCSNSDAGVGSDMLSESASLGQSMRRGSNPFLQSEGS